MQKLPKEQLWFDVEKRYKTMAPRNRPTRLQLWFDVEKRYKTMCVAKV